MKRPSVSQKQSYHETKERYRQILAHIVELLIEYIV